MKWLLGVIILTLLLAIGTHEISLLTHKPPPTPRQDPPRLHKIQPPAHSPLPLEHESMISPKHLLAKVIQPTLLKLAVFDARMNNKVAEDLLLGTAAQESDLGFMLAQVGGGPGNGIYQMEGATHRSLWRHYLSKPDKARLKEILLAMVPASAVRVEDGYTYVDDAQLIVNLEYATAMARVKYWPVKAPLPAPGDLHGLAAYYKAHYNTASGAATPQEFVDSWNKFVAANL
jgi:hypothetical protein